jgi:hypothetical protein
MRLVPQVPETVKKRYETLLREFEWTWTKAAVAALVLWFLAILFIGVIPSFWLYWAQRPATNWIGRLLHFPWSQDKFWLYKLRDVVAAGLFTAPTVAFMVIPYFVQKQRQRLRGANASRVGGGYR